MSQVAQSNGQMKQDNENKQKYDNRQKQKLDNQNNQIYESPPVLIKSEFDLLKKYKSLAGSPKRVNRSIKYETKVKQKLDYSLQRKKKSPLDSYIKKLQNLKTKIETPKKKQKQKQSNQNLILGLNLISKVRESKIKLIDQKVHEKNVKYNDKPLQQQVFDVRKSKSISKITFYDEAEKQKRLKKKKDLINNHKTSKIKLDSITNFSQTKTFNVKRNSQINLVSDSLKNLRGKIRQSSGISYQKNKTYFKSLNSSNENQKSFDKFKQDIKNNNLNQSKKSPQTIKSKESGNQSPLIIKSKQSEKLQNNLNQNSIIKIFQVEQQKQQSSVVLKKQNQVKIQEKTDLDQNMRKTLYAKKKQLQQIREDIENQNIQKLEEINIQKQKQKKIESSIQKKKYRIQQLQQRVQEFENESNEKNDEDQLKLLQIERKKKIQEFQLQKSQILKQAKEIQERMVSQEQKFINLKEKEIEIRQADIEQKYAQMNKNAVIQMQKKTKKLQQVISQEEKKRKLHQRQLNQQVQRNQLIHKQLQKQEQLQALLIARIQGITEKRNNKRQKQQQKKRKIMKNQIQQLQNTHKQVLLQYQRDSQRLGSMFQSMRKKNLQLESKIKSRTNVETI